MKRFLALVLVAGCGSGAKPPATPPASPLPASPPAAAPVAELTRLTGETKLTDVPATGTARTRGADDRAVYVAVDVEASAAPISTEWIRVEAGGAYGLAVPGQNGDQILVRFPGKALPDALTLTWTLAKDPGDGYGGGERRTVALKGLGAAAPDPALPRNFLRAAAPWFTEHGQVRYWSSLPFYAYAAGRLTFLADRLEPKGANVPRQERRTDVGELMDLYTGMTSVDEAMQADRGLMLPADDAPATLPLASVAPLALPAHPWDKMIGELPGRPQPVVEPLARSVPADFLYLHAHDLRRLVVMARAFDERFAPIAAVLEQRGGSAEMVARIERELAVERSGLAEKLGHLAAGGVALVASDPFFREGTDVSLLFLVKNEALLGTALAEFATRSKGTWSEVTIAGKKVKLLSTPEGDVHRYELRLGDVLVLSNSPGAMARLIEVAAGKRPNLAASGDFRYFRALYPAGADQEDVFVFASDAFIQATVSPRTKILEARRLRDRSDLTAVNHGALLHGWLEGKPPASAAELERSGLGTIPRGVTFSPERGASSARGGTAQRSTPIIDLELTKVTPAEKAGYERFRDTYQSYWRGYIDPIGARLTVTDDGGLAFDARMLPLIAGTDYDKLREQVGDRRVAPPQAKGGVHFVLAVGDDAMLRREIDRAARSFGRGNDLSIGWLGDWVAIGAADRSALWDLALLAGELPELSPGARERLGDDRRAFNRKLWPRMPFYAMAHVRSKLGLIAALTAVRKYVDDAAPGQLDWGPGTAYRGVEVVRVGPKPRAEVDDELADMAVYYAIVNDVLVVAVDRSTFEHAADLVLDKRAAREAKKGDVAMQTVLSVDAPADGPMRRTALAILEKLARRDAKSALRQWEAVARGFPGDKEPRRAAWFLGETPVAAAGGVFGLDADGAASHSLFGNDAHPIVPAALPADSPLAAALGRLAGFDLGLAFDGKGNHQGLHSAGRMR